MKKLKTLSRTITILSALTVVYFICSAHFIWTETTGIATIGKQHEVNLFFGEYNFNQLEVTGGRLDEMTGLKSGYINPKGSMNDLVLKQEKDRFSTSFTPDQTGVYQILTSNEVAKVMDLRTSNLGIVKPMYYSRQFVLCPSQSDKDDLKSAKVSPYFELDLIPDFSTSTLNVFPVNEPIKFHSYFKKAPVKGGKIYVHAPNGWSKEVDADKTGLCTFIPLWKGQYVIDWVYTENKPGSFKDKAYESVRHRAILTINVGQ